MNTVLLLASVVMLLAAPACADGGAKSSAAVKSSKNSKQSGDGYYKPIAKNKNWKLYEFGATMEQKVTSFRPAPPPNVLTDPNQPGAIATLSSEVFLNGDQIGIGSWNRIVVSNDPVDPDAPDGDRIANRLLLALYEFGTPEDGYPDALSVTVGTKWLLSPDNPSEFTDYDGVISGGTGRFVGASGRVSVSDVVIVDNLLQSATFNFKFYVPAGLPKAF